MVSTLLTMFVSNNPFGDIKQIISIFEYAIVFWLGYTLNLDLKSQEISFKIITLVGSFIALTSILLATGFLDIHLGDVRAPRVSILKYRAIGWLEIYGSFGVWMQICLGIILASLMQPLFKKAYNYIILLVLLSGVFVSQSRATWLTTFLVLSVFLIMLLYFKLRKLKFGALIGGIASIGIVVVVYLSFWQFILDLFEYLIKIKPLSYVSRLNQYVLAISIIKDQPLLGLGADVFSQISADGSVLHNTFLDIYVRSGLIGFVGYVSIWMLPFFALIRTMVKLKDTRYKLFCVAYLIGIIGMCIQSQFYLADGFLLIWFFLGMATAFMSLQGVRKDVYLNA
ncbi:MAG: O-antigen ligase family protein [Candidatus Marinimicrobia bacterium]|nr:O-antigen ligase family protein [Candidatus Neomarinimicrobiota bacterium]